MVRNIAGTLMQISESEKREDKAEVVQAEQAVWTAPVIRRIEVRTAQTSFNTPLSDANSVS